MSPSKQSTRKRTTKRAPQQKQAEPQTPSAKVVVEERVAPEQRRGKSSVESPVATVWVNSHNMFSQARANGTEPPSRKDLVRAAMDAGVSYYTARTQVQAYLKASKGGTEVPTKLPRNVAISA